MKKLVVLCACVLLLCGQGQVPAPTRTPTVEASTKYPDGTKVTTYFGTGATLVHEQSKDRSIEEYTYYYSPGVIEKHEILNFGCNEDTGVTTSYDKRGNITSVISSKSGIHFSSRGTPYSSAYEVTKKTWRRDSSGRITAQVTTTDSASGSTGTLVQTRYDSPSDASGSRETTALHGEDGHFVSSTGTPVEEYLGEPRNYRNFSSLKIAKDAAPEDLCSLNGTWIAQYHNPDTVDAERIKIVQAGRSVTATKTTGDPYVPAGNVTFQGTFTTNPFPVKSLCAQKGFSNPTEHDATVAVTDKNHFTITVPDCDKVPDTFERAH
jgi:hypothetical protein